jgi:predicted AAA+ superfamily ATPase
MLERIMATKLKEVAKRFPVVLISGPRQSGKTTLARMVLPGHQYVSLEDPEEPAS